MENVIIAADKKIGGEMIKTFSRHGRGQIGIEIVDIEDEKDKTVDILVLTENDRGRCSNIKCTALLLPGNMMPGGLKASFVVSYGMSPKDSITMSSIGKSECVLALQREIVTVGGVVMEQQEIPVHKIHGLSPNELMAVSGAMVLSGYYTE